MAREKVILAYSGGLDTSCCIKWLMTEKNLDVITLLVNVGQEADDLEFSRKKALDCGAIESILLDVREEFVDDFLTKEIAANGLYEGKYPLLSALSRPVDREAPRPDGAHLRRARASRTATPTAQGQRPGPLRGPAVQALDPSLKVIAPVREWDLLARPQEIAFAEANGIPVGVSKAKPYSIDDNLWGRAIECGVLEDPWNEPPADIWATTSDIADAPDQPEVVVVGFKAGVPCSINGEAKSLLDVIEELNVIAGRNGYGRLDVIENRLVGVKSRECYEQPGALAIIEAHKALEDLCLERDLLHDKLGLEHEWSKLVYNGLWYSPLQEGARRLHGEHAGLPHRRGAPALPQGHVRGDRPPQRVQPLRPEPGHLRRGRHVRPGLGRRLHLPVGPALQGVGWPAHGHGQRGGDLT